MAKLRKFQFLRNKDNNISSFASYALARTAAETAFAGIELEDGEIALYSYKLDNAEEDTVHTLLGIKRDGGIEILGNYDELTANYQSFVSQQIHDLDSETTGSNNGVSVTVKQVDGIINSVSVVAPSLTAAIEALDVDAFSLTEVTGTELKGYQISEVDGKIVKGETAETLLTFASAPTAGNKVATQAEIAALDAEVTSTDGTNVQVKVTEVDGVITAVNVTTDNTINATDLTNAIAGLDATVSNVNALTNGTATNDIRVEVVETDGKLTAVNVTDTLAAVAHSGKAADVTIADTAELFTATNVEDALAEVMTKANLSAGKGIDINGTTINADLNLSIANETTGEGESVVTTTYLYIKDTEGNEISKVNANAFVKDGFLQKVEKDAENNTLVFTWNTDAGIEQTTIAISDLCDVYTADETYLHLNGYKFEHKTSGVTAGEYAANAADVTVNSTTSQSFNIPTLTVDAAGHVTAASEKTVTISLPASIDTAIQGGAGVNTTYIQTTVNRNATETNQLDVTATAIIGDYADENQKDGLATTTATKTYVDSKINALDDSMTTVTNGVGIALNDDGTGNDHKYTVSLAKAPATVTNDTDDYVAANGTHTRISDITVDEYGRVTAVTKTTVTEDFDAGTY